MEKQMPWDKNGRHRRPSSRIKLPTVAIISDERFPHHATNTQQVVKNAESLAAAGLPLELVIPAQKKGLFERGYSVSKTIYQYYNVSDRLKIRQLFTIPASDLRYEKFTHCFASLLYATHKKFDIIYTRNEFTAILSVMFGKKTVFETYRKFGDEYPRAMRWLSKWAHKPAFLGMVLHSHLSYNSMKNAGFPEEKLKVFHNGFDYADMQTRLNKTEARLLLGWDTELRYAIYTGNMQSNKGIESVIHIAGLLPDVHFVFVGGTPEDILRLKTCAKNQRVINLHFTGNQPIKEVSKYLYAADVLIIPPVSAPLEKYGRTVLPFKTFLYLAAGRPIVAPKLDDLSEVLEHGYNALLVEPDNIVACADTIKSLFANPALYLSISENALASASLMTWEVRAKNIIEWLAKIFYQEKEELETMVPVEEKEELEAMAPIEEKEEELAVLKV